MFAAVDAPKSKSITLAFVALKSTIFGIMLTTSFMDLQAKHQQQQCQQTLSQLPTVYELFYILGSLLDCFLMVLFFFTEKFNRMWCYILLAFHIILTCFIVITSLITIGKIDPQKCIIQKQFIGISLLVTVIFLVDSIIVMWSNLYIGLKFIHFGASLIWPLMWLLSMKDGNIWIGMIGIIHGVLLIIGVFTFGVLNILKKSSKTAKIWKQLYAISIIFMIFCYIVSFVSEVFAKYSSAFLMSQTYKKFGLFQIITPTLTLIFLNTQLGDPRQHILRKNVQLFEKTRQNQSFKIDDTN